MFRFLIAACIGLALGGPAQGYDDRGVVEVFGAATTSCPDFLGDYAWADVKRIEGDIRYRQHFASAAGWVAGYMTAVNWLTPGAADVYEMDLADAVQWLAQWCGDKPAAILWYGMIALTNSRPSARSPSPDAPPARR